MDFFTELQRMADEIASLPPRPAYIVLDHGHTGPPSEEHDKDGRFFVRCSPALLGELKHTKLNPSKEPGRASIAMTLGIPVYKKQDMKEGYG